MAPDPSPAAHRLTFTVLAVGVTAFSLVQSLIIPVMGGLARQYGTDPATITWLLTAYLMSASVCTPILGRLGDAWGKNRVLVGCLTVLAVGCAVSALAPDLGWLITGRAVQGVGGGILPVSFGIIRDEFPPENRPFAIGFVSSLLAFGIGCGTVVAGPIVDALGYGALFWLPCLASAAAAVVAFRFVPPSPARSRERISVLPAVLLATWLIMLVLAISEAPRWGWNSRTVLGLLAGAIVLLTVWVRVETTCRPPLIDLRLMRRPGVGAANLVALLTGFGLYAFSSLVPQLAQTSPAVAGFGLDFGAGESGLMMLPGCLLSFVAGLLAAPAAQRFGAKRLMLIGALTGAAGTALLVFRHDQAWHLYLGTSINGFGIGLTLALLANVVVATVPASQTGVASGTNANLRTIGGAIGSGVLASVIAGSQNGAGVPTEEGYVHGFAVITCLLLAAGAAALSIPPLLQRDREARPATELASAS
ncbi:MFS transporter [Streptomyces sp. NPDC001068]|uniref:MFS transporter n=1 Tax=Streptomyces sp. NPDC001068 TaxID=3364544 RepID=UPI0036A072A5